MKVFFLKQVSKFNKCNYSLMFCWLFLFCFILDDQKILFFILLSCNYFRNIAIILFLCKKKVVLFSFIYALPLFINVFLLRCFFIFVHAVLFLLIIFISVSFFLYCHSNKVFFKLSDFFYSWLYLSNCFTIFVDTYFIFIFCK